MAKAGCLAMGMMCILLVFPACFRRVAVNEGPVPVQAWPGTGSAREPNAPHPLLVQAWRERLAWWCGEKMEPQKPPEPIREKKTPRIPVQLLPDQPGIQGQVASDWGDPLPGVSVTLSGSGNKWTATTNEEGCFIFKDLPPGVYSLRGELEGFYPAVFPEIHFAAGEKISKNMELRMPPLRENPHDLKGNSFCDERKLAGMPCISYPKHDVVDFRSIGMVPGKTSRPGISGTITFDTGKVVSGVKVSLDDNRSGRWEKPYYQETYTNENGDYAFYDLNPGLYSLEMEFEGTIPKVIYHIDYREKEKLDISQKLRMDDTPIVDYIYGNSIVDVKHKGHRPRRVQKISGMKVVWPLQPWRPHEPYLGEDQVGLCQDSEKIYLRQREHYRNSPAFFLAWVDYFFKLRRERRALRVLEDFSNLAAGNSELLRVLGYRLQRWGKVDKSAAVFEKVLRLQPDLFQSWRDLALAMVALKKYEQAARLFQYIMTNPVIPSCWNLSLGIEIISLMEWNMAAVQAKNTQGKFLAPPPELQGQLDLDLRVVLFWDASGADVDLVVEEPTGERADYSSCRTQIGGITSSDACSLGPEEYLLRKAAPGKYKIYARYFIPDHMTLLVPVTVQADLFTNWGRTNEKKLTMIRQLESGRGTVLLGEVEF